MFNCRIIVLAAICLCLPFKANLVVREAIGQERSSNRPRQASVGPTGEVTVAIEEQFVNSFLDTLFANLKGPSYPLSATGVREKRSDELSSHAPSSQNECPSIVNLEREKGGVRTSVHFEDGRIGAPLAFSGSYSNSFVGCLRFEGSTDTIINLEFDRAKQSLNARASVKDIHLIGVPSLANGPVIRLVQNAIDRRINPIHILQTSQLAAHVPIPGSNGAVSLHAKEIRPEVLPGVLRLHVTYEFAAVR